MGLDDLLVIISIIVENAQFLIIGPDFSGY